MACCPNCSGRVFEAEKVVSRKRWYHKSCFKCHTCQHLLDQTNFNDGPDGHIYCNTCLKNMDLLDSNLTARSMMETTKIKGDEGNKDTCCRKYCLHRFFRFCFRITFRIKLTSCPSSGAAARSLRLRKCWPRREFTTSAASRVRYATASLIS